MTKINFNTFLTTTLLFLSVFSQPYFLVYAQTEEGPSGENDQIITNTTKWLMDGLKYVHINIDAGGFISRLRNDFKPKEWLSSAGGELSGTSGKDLGPKISQLWLKTNEWMESRIGISIEEGIGRFLVSVFVTIFKFLAGVLKSIVR